MVISVFGTGYVGVVTGTCFADLGNHVICVDIDAERVERLRGGDPVIYEPGLKELLERNLRAGRLEFTTDGAAAVRAASVIFICVGTPARHNGEADLSYVRGAASAIGQAMDGYKVIVNKSTVPVGTYELVRRTIRDAVGDPNIEFDVVSNPEFLREGAAIRDFQNPDRIVVGTDSERARQMMNRLYAPVVRTSRPIMFTSIPSAELIKYASNAMLATRISFMNELSHLCEQVGGDITEVARGMGLDGRIGPRFLHAGCGYGGSCFPKDVKALAQILEQHGLTSTLLQAVDYINERQKRSIVQKLRTLLPDLDGKNIAVWGLAFKPRTDDVREAPALVVIDQLLRAYARVRAYDPEALENARRMLPESPGLSFAPDAYSALEGADALLVLTEWDEFREPDLPRMRELMRTPNIVDGRNIFDQQELAALGFRCVGIGRGAAQPEN
jgi:UDPglucose 6-dehydrogenase